MEYNTVNFIILISRRIRWIILLQCHRNNTVTVIVWKVQISNGVELYKLYCSVVPFAILVYFTSRCVSFRRDTKFPTLFLVAGAVASARCSRTRSLRRRSHEGDTAASSSLSKRRRWSRRSGRWSGPRKCDACQAGPVPEEHRRADGKTIGILFLQIYWNKLH